MELKRLIAMLDRATFQDRQTIAAAAARTATPESLERIARLLIHPSQPVRLGAIEIIAATRFRPALAELVTLAEQHGGEERVFAARALAHMAEPADRERLEPLARAWLTQDDPHLHTHATTLLARIQAAPAAAAGQAPGQPAGQQSVQKPGPDPDRPAGSLAGLTAPDRATRQDAIARAVATLAEPGPVLVDALLEARRLHPGARLDLIAALDELGPERFARAALRLLAQADGDVIALVARALSRHMPQLPASTLAELRPVIDRAYGRLRSHELARAALDECLVVAPDNGALAALVARVAQLASATARRLAERLAALPAEQRLAHIPALITALAQAPRRALLFSDLLRSAWPGLAQSQRTELRQILDTAASVPLPADLSASALARIGLLHAAILSPGDRAPQLVLEALEARTEPEAALAAIAIHRALASETAARRLVAYLGAPAAEVREAARAALQGLAAPHVKVVFAEDGSARIEPDYRTPTGEPLIATHGVLTTTAGVRYVLDASNMLVPERATEWGGCRCCERPRALERSKGRRPICPVTREPHLVEDGKPMLERDHALGGCTACESLQPLVRQGGMVRCEACHTEHVQVGGRYVKRRRTGRRGGDGVEPLERPGPLSKQDLPQPPSASDLQLVEPTIGHAMAANVFLIGEAQDTRWAGSGVIVARDGSEIAILTNRHVVEDKTEEGQTLLARMRVFTISGELVPAEVRWRARQGLDLALVVARLQQPERVALAALQDGACLVGSELFAIGNPFSLSWSYSSGTLAAFRSWALDDGLEVRFIQSHVPMSPGSSGGGLYHKRGHLVGINSFGYGNVVGPGGDHNFSIAMPSVLAALRREGVVFAGKLLVEP